MNHKLLEMRKINFLFIGIITLLSISACNNNDEDDDTSSACSDNKNFCVKIGSEQITEDATYIVITTGSPTRHRIYWEEGSGNSYKNIELDIHTDNLTAGTYDLVENPSDGQASLQYYTEQKGFISTAGSVTITSATSSNISGTFSGTVDYQGDSRSVTDGNFVNVPM